MNHRIGPIAVGTILGLIAASYAASVVFMFFARIDTDLARPWSIFQYLYYYAHDPKLSKAFLLAGVAALMVVAGMLYLALNFKRPNTYGDARWARRYEIKEAGLLGSAGLLIGRVF